MIPREFAETFAREAGWDLDCGAVLLVDLLFHDPEGTGPAWEAFERTGALRLDGDTARSAAGIIFGIAKKSEEVA